MGSCATCGDSTDLPYTCNYCGLRHCSNHRLPENHNCVGLSSASTHGPDFRTRDQWAVPDHPGPNGAGNTSRSIWKLLVVAAIVVGGAVLWTGYIDTGDFSSIDGLDTDGDVPDAVGATANSSAATSTGAQDTGGSQEDPSTPTTTRTPEGTLTESTRVQEAVEKSVHEQINRERADRGLSALDYDEQLSEIAWRHSRDMAVNEFFSHTGSDGASRSSRYEEVGYECRVPAGGSSYLTGGENIYRTFYSGIDYSPDEIAQLAVEGWMDSTGHRENILRSEWRKEGIGVYTVQVDGEMRVYITQDFC